MTEVNMLYRIAALMNDGEGRFSGLNKYGGEPDLLVPGPMVEVFAESPEAALDKAWVVGNREASDARGFPWPSTVRSLSVGDVLLITNELPWAAYAIAGVGFDPVSADVVAAGLRGAVSSRGASL